MILLIHIRIFQISVVCYTITTETPVNDDGTSNQRRNTEPIARAYKQGSFNPNVPPGFVVGGSPTAEKLNGSLNISNISPDLSSLPTTTTTFSKLSSREPSSVISTHPDNRQTNSTNMSNQTKESTTEIPTNVTTKTDTTESPVKPVPPLYHNGTKTHSLKTTTTETFKIAVNSTITALTTLNNSTVSRQTTTIIPIKLVSKPPITPSLAPANSPNNTELTAQTTIFFTTEKNISLNNSTTVQKRPTTDPFNDNRPWNIHRSTNRPNGKESVERRTTSESNGYSYDKGDTFWPVATALTMGIPAIIVFAVTIAVLYRRRMNKPRGLLEMYGTDYQAI